MSFIKNTLFILVLVLVLVAVNTNVVKAAVSFEQQIETRREIYLNWIMEEFVRLETTMKPFDGRLWSLNHARLFRGVDLRKANRYFETVKLTLDPDFMGIRLLKTLLEFRDTNNLSEKSKTNLTNIIENWPMEPVQSRLAKWPPAFTENHDLMYLTIGLFSKQFRGQSIEGHLSELKKSLAWRYERGFYEWGSHRYQMHYSNPLQVLAEFAPDVGVRRGAEDLLNLMLAERVLLSVNGYLGGPGMRSYGRNRGCDYLDNNRYDSFLPTIWLAFGVAEPRFDFSKDEELEPAGDGYGNKKDPRLNQDEAMFFATNKLIPYPILYELLSDVTQESEFIYTGRRSSAGHPFQNGLPSEYRSHQSIYYYNTPHVSMGSMQYLPYAGKMSVSFNSQPRFFSILFPEDPSQVLRTGLSSEELAAGTDKYTYSADKVVQHGNWLVAGGELSASHGLQSRKIGVWDLFEVGDGLCAHIELDGGWHVFQVSDLAKYPDAESFVDSLSVPRIEKFKVFGVSNNGDELSVDLVNMSIKVNGILRKSQIDKLHESRFMESIYGSGVIRIRTKESSKIFNKKILENYR